MSGDYATLTAIGQIVGHGNQSHFKYWVRTPEQPGSTRAAEKTVLTNQAQGNGKERSVLPNPGGVGMKNNSFTSVIRKPYRGRAGLKRDASVGERLRLHQL